MRHSSCFYVVNLADKSLMRRNPASTQIPVPQCSSLHAGKLKNFKLTALLLTGLLIFGATSPNYAKEEYRPEIKINVVDIAESNINGNVATNNTFQNMPPVAVCKNIIVHLGPGGTVSITGQDVDGGSYDPDGTIVSRIVNPGTFTCSEIGVNAVTLTVTDDGGLFSACTATVTVEDSIPPTMICRDYTLYLDRTGAASLVPADINNGSSDNCSGSLSLFLSRTIFNCSDTGSPVPVTLTGTDASGNFTICTSQITVLDTVSPTVNLKTFNLVLDAAGTGTLLPSDVDNGTFDNCGPVTLSVAPNTFSCGDQGTHVVTLTAIDSYGNSSSDDITVTIYSSLEIKSMSLNNCDLAVPYALYRSYVEGGDGNYSYFWDGLEDYVNPFIEIIPVPPYLLFTNTSTAEAPFFNNTMPDGIYNIRLIVTDGNGCVDTSEMRISVAGPVFNNITQAFSNACEGEIITYAVNHDTAAVYSWIVENGTILTSDPDTNVIDVQWNVGITLGVVNTIITKPNLLGDPCVSSVIDTVSISTVPAPLFDNPVTSVCSGSEYTYTLTDSFASYNWTVTGGVITYGGTGGVNNATVRWITGSAGRVTVEVENDFGCTGSVFVDVNINNLSGSVTSLTDISCSGDFDGQVTVSATAGTGQPPYEYSLDGGAYQPDGTFTNVSLGNHIVRIRDGLLCTFDVFFTVTQPPVLTGSISSQTDVSCFGGSDGSVTISASGGTPPYEYSLDAGPYQDSNMLTGLSAGLYTITIRDNNNCLHNIPVMITQPFAPLTGLTVVANVLCFGEATGAIDLIVTGGTAPYTYLWSNGATTEDLTNITAGTYTVTITDANGCTATAGGTVTQPAEAIAGTTAVTDVLCFGDATGAIDLTVTGGTVPYTYFWSTGATTKDVTNLTAATYTVTITDANGCTATSGGTVAQPAAALSGTATVTDVSCFSGSDGAIELAVTGGTSPYTFLWSNGATTEGINGLTPGTYTVTITDANSCTATAGGTVSQPAAPLAGTTVMTDVLCFGEATGTVDLTVTGGTAPYAYLWSNGATTEDLANIAAGTYTVTITDANGCTANATGIVTEPLTALTGSITSQTNVTSYGGSDGSVTVEGSGGTPSYRYKLDAGAYQASGTFGSLTAGTYTVTVQDNNLCTFDVPVTITQPPEGLYGIVISQTSVSCFGGNDGGVTVEGIAGNPPYEYSLNGGTYQSSGTFTTLIAGAYTVAIRDAALDLYYVPVTISEPDELTITTTQVDVLCMGEATGSATVIVAGGTEPYSYSWNTLPEQTTATATGLSAETYTVTVTDANGCVATANVTITQPAIALTVTVTQINNLCFGGATGSATAAADGGTAPYTFTWDTSPEQTTPTASGLAAGNYTVTVTDFNGCVVTRSVQITEPAAIVIEADVTDASCPDEANGSITLTITGGVPPYFVIWSDGTETLNRGNLLPGTYSVVVTDQNGCAQAADMEVGFIGTFNCVVIPQIITPNNDGYNDEWILRNIYLYPDAEVLVFNRWGRLIFRTKNISANPWDGRLDGELVPTDSYHYILYLIDGSEPRTGVISVIR